MCCLISSIVSYSTGLFIISFRFVLQNTVSPSLLYRSIVIVIDLVIDRLILVINHGQSIVQVFCDYRLSLIISDIDKSIRIDQYLLLNNIDFHRLPIAYYMLCSCFRANKHVTWCPCMCLVNVKLFGVFQPAPKM